MENEGQVIFTEKDIYRAFDMGLKSAIHVLEISHDLSPKDQQELLDHLKKMTEN